ncbi:hypothetical protein [Lysobacter sp. A3-1-A15]|uniref:hypothetical protein n=1 Tax=Novilysobacter viscosus TaxID=3098602 RepID=UPI002EDA3AB3
MPRPAMPLEDLGLLCLLEKIGTSGEPVDAYARLGLIRRGLVTNSETPALTDAGRAMMSELRDWRDEGEVDPGTPDSGVSPGPG